MMLIQIPKETLIRFQEELQPFLEGTLAKRENYPLLERCLAERTLRAFSEGLACLEASDSTLGAELKRVDPEKQLRYRSAPDLWVLDRVSECLNEQFDFKLHWLCAGWGLWVCDFSFGIAPHLEKVAQHDPSEVLWLVAAASWVQHWSGENVDPVLGPMLARLDHLEPTLRSRLLSASLADDEFQRQAGIRGLAAWDRWGNTNPV